jgi:hypothetical protein
MKPDPIQIAQLIQQNGLSSSNHGLMHGNIGMSIFFYHLSRNTNNPDYENIADDLLDKAFENMTTSTSVDFENGLAGIGWGIEYLIQNKFADGITDEILEEADNKVFRLLSENIHPSFELSNGLMGYLFYLIYRLKNKDIPLSTAQRINRELLIVAINKLDELVTTQFPSISKEMNFDLFWRFPVMLFGITEAFKLDIYNEKIRCMIRQWLPFFETYIPSLHINRLFIAVVLKRINLLMPDKRLDKQIQILLFAIDFDVLKTEVDHYDISIRSGWPGVTLLLNIALKELPTDSLNLQLIEQTLHTITEKHKNTLDHIPQDISEESYKQYGLSSGLAGIGLMELLWQGIISGETINS